ncbi:heavy metal translocating P-type ATPase [Limnoglobus roseus]|nr:heavy metal translocating P-type ATPase [Limnoglobus roseus]
MPASPISSPDSAAAGRYQASIAAAAAVAIALHVTVRGWGGGEAANAPLWLVLATGGGALILGLLRKLVRGEFGADLLAGIAIATAAALGEYLAGTIVVLMLAGGTTLEAYAVRRASSALDALVRRMPAAAHRSRDGTLTDVPLADVAVGDLVVVFPHETCPVDGVVVDGHGTMDESYLTGEPHRLAKAPGAEVLSGAVNGDAALTVRAERPAVDSRYAKIVRVMRETELRRPRLRRLGDRLGALYTPFAVAVALLAWAASGDPARFLSVLVIATPCPLLIAIPVAVIGAVSVAARRGIVIKDPAVLEALDTCRTAVFDKTGTLTYGRPALVELTASEGFRPAEVLGLTAGLERYSRHPLAAAVLDAARAANVSVWTAAAVSERPGEGLTGRIDGKHVRVTGRKQLAAEGKALPPSATAGLECVVLVDGRLAGVLHFRDRPRDDSSRFIDHLGRRHGFRRVLLVSGDRESEVRYLAEAVGITEVYAGQSPEQKVAVVRAENEVGRTLFVGDGVNDAPALAAATVGLAFGRNSDVTAEAAAAVILDASLRSVDELFHICRRARRLALQSAVGGIALSVAGMALAAGGWVTPVAGAVLQEVIDVLVVLNALRASFPPRTLTDY